MARYELTDEQWNLLKVLFPTQKRGGEMERSSHHAQRHALDSAFWSAVARPARSLRKVEERLSSLQPLATRRPVRSHSQSLADSARQARQDRLGSMAG